MTKTTEDFKKDAVAIHGDKYDYSSAVYTGSHSKLTIICKEHGKFDQLATSHLLGNGCTKCGYDKVSSSKQLNTYQFIKRATKIHKNAYDYSSTIYTNCYDKVIIICKTHGVFTQAAYSHLHGIGCPTCGIKKSVIHRSDDIKLFIIKSRKIHGNKYEYPGQYVGNKIKIQIICKKHGSFLCRPGDHIQGVGCPTCCGSISSAECKWLDSLDVQQRQVTLNINKVRCRVDGFDPETNTIYEFWGDYWHGNPAKYKSTDIHPVSRKTFGELYERTMKKRQAIMDAGYNLIEMWESDWNKLKQ